jgi:hypothetical protein
MKKSYGKDRASHTDPESCTVAREGGCEALTGVCAGGLLSREILLVRGADVVSVGGRLHPMHRYGKRHGDLARSWEPSHAQNHLTREPGDPVCARQRWLGGPYWEVQRRTPMMHEHRKSDRRVVPTKPPNNGAAEPPQGRARATPADAVEGRRLAKSKPHQQTMLWPQRRVRMSPVLARIWMLSGEGPYEVK